MVKANLSIIIPVYNASRYIERCLQSVEKQTLQNIEVILVDDHGQDDSIVKAKAFAAESKRKDIQYVFAQTLTNSGPASARNIGMQQAKGEYIAFLDADDWIEPQMYEQLYCNAKTHDADISCSNAMQDFEDGIQSTVLCNPKIESGVFSIADKKRFLTTFVAYFWTYIYRRTWLISNQLTFVDAKSAEDSSFLACCVLAAERVAQILQPFYHYTIHLDSLSQRKVWKGREKRKALKSMCSFAKRKGLMRTYWPQLWYVYIKKAIIVPIVEMIK